jgi:hypothetical protein
MANLKENPRGKIGSGGLYREFSAERQEILRHKYLLSEKAKCDVGFEVALVDWVTNHRAAWSATRGKNGVAS